MAEHFSCKEDVVGSIPTPGSFYCFSKVEKSPPRSWSNVSDSCCFKDGSGIPDSLLQDVYHQSVALSDREIAILDFERTAWRVNGSKEAAIRQRFGLSPSRYYQIRSILLDMDEAMEYDPLVVRRLRRSRTQRRSIRYGIPLIQPPIR